MSSSSDYPSKHVNNVFHNGRSLPTKCPIDTNVKCMSKQNLASVPSVCSAIVWLCSTCIILIFWIFRLRNHLLSKLFQFWPHNDLNLTFSNTIIWPESGIIFIDEDNEGYSLLLCSETAFSHVSVSKCKLCIFLGQKYAWNCLGFDYCST